MHTTLRTVVKTFRDLVSPAGRSAVTRSVTWASYGVWAIGFACVITPSPTELAVANGDTRTIHFYHTHTGESIDATFRVDGHYDQAVLDKLNYFLRDWRNNDQTHMDPRLFDTIWEVYRTAGADQPIQIYSAYRSPETNAMLRRRSRAVAEHSQHMLGKAMDTTMPGMPMERIREIGMRLQHGGVGYYQSANFVHLDVGGVRSWPRMNYDQLARLFPDGKTVHIPSNGQPMARYEEARAEIAARGGTDIPPAQQSQGFFAWLFGGSGTSASHEDEEDRTAVAARAPTRARAPTAALAYNNPEGDEGALAPTDTRGRPRAGSVQTAGFSPAQQPTAVAAAGFQPNPDAAQAVQTADSADTIPAAFGGSIPLPPRRPAELLASLELIPLPPVRPDATFAVASIAQDLQAMPTPPARPAVVPDAIGGLITSTTSGVPMLRRASLPSIITQGSDAEKNRPPLPALAFASADTTSSLRPSVHESVAHEGLTHAGMAPVRGLGLRAVTASSRTDQTRVKPTDTRTASSDGAMPLSAPSIYGLRKAARSRSGPAEL